MATSDSHPEFGVYVPDVTLTVAKGAGGGSPPSAFTPMVVESADAITDGDPFLNWYNSVADTTRARNGSKSVKVTLQQGQGYPICGGGRGFGRRNNLPQTVPEGGRLWIRMYFYFPSTMSAGYVYGGDSKAGILSAENAGATSVSIDTNDLDYGTPTLQVGDPINIRMDDMSNHPTFIDSLSGTSGVITIGLTDPLPAAISAGSNNFECYQIAEAIHCGFGSADGSGRVKWLVFAPSNGSGRLYLQLHNDNRSTAGFSGMNLRSEAGSALALFNDQPIPTDRWFSLQLEVYVHSDPSQGYMRAWLDDTYVGQLSAATIDSSSNSIREWGLGDYFNGTPYTDGDLATTADFWVDDIIVASDADGYGAPTGVDSSSRIYIDPNTSAGDF